MAVFRKLLQPGSIGPLTLRNRIVMTAMGNNLAENGMVTDRQIAYFEERAKGGVEYCRLSGNDGKKY